MQRLTLALHTNTIAATYTIVTIYPVVYLIMKCPKIK